MKLIATELEFAAKQIRTAAAYGDNNPVTLSLELAIRAQQRALKIIARELERDQEAWKQALPERRK